MPVFSLNQRGPSSVADRALMTHAGIQISGSIRRSRVMQPPYARARTSDRRVE